MADNNTSIGNKYKYIDTDIDRDLLIKNLQHNAQSYVRYKGWDESKTKEFYDALATFEDAMQEGRLSSTQSGSIMDSKGELNNGKADWRDKDGKVYSEEMYNALSDRQKKRKGLAQDFYANREVASYIGEVAKKIYDKTKEEAEKNKPVPRKFDLKNDGVWGKFVLDIAPNGKLDTDSWLALDTYDSTTKKRDTVKRAKQLADFITSYTQNLDPNLDFSESSFGTKDAYIKRLTDLSNALKNGVNEDDYRLLNQLGGDPEQYKAFFTTAEKYSSEEPQEKKEEPAKSANVKTEETQRLNDLAKSYVQVYNSKRYQQYTLKNQPTGVKVDAQADNPLTAYQNALNAARIDFSVPRLQNSDGREYVNYIEQYGNMNPNAVRQVINGKYAGWYYIPESLNITDLSVLSYNPNKHSVARLYYGTLGSNEAWNEYRKILQQIGTSEQRSASTPFQQQGGTVETLEQEQPTSPYGAVELFDRQQKALSRKTKSDPKLRQPWKEGNNYSSNEFTATDKARLGAIAADIAALVDPEPISAGVLGVGSDITNFVADIKEGYGIVNSLGNFAGNLGLSVLGTIPVFGDALGSGSKIVKGLVKFAPKINKLLLGTGLLAGVSNADEIIKSFSKIGKDGPENEMNVQDWRNVGLGLQYVLGGASAVRNARAVKKAQQAKAASATDYVDVRVKDQSSGQEKVLRFGGKQDTEALKNAKTPDEVNAVINAHPSMKNKYKVVTETESSHKTHLFSAGYDQGKWYKPWTWREKISSDNLAEGVVGTVYDARKFHNNYNVRLGRGQHLNNFVTDTNADAFIKNDYKPRGATPISKMRELTLRRKAAQYRQSFKSTVGKAHSPEFKELIARGFTSADLRLAGLWQQGGTIGTPKQTKNDPKPSQSKKDENNRSSIEFTSNDLIRLGALSADIVAFIDPEPISALALGVGSDAANLVADIREGKDFPTTTSNLLQNLGLSSLGVIPIVGDVAGSGNKIVRTLVKLAPKLTKFIRSADAYDIKTQADEISKSLDVKGILKSLDKVGKDGLEHVMTRQDWENIREAIQFVLDSAHINIDTGTVGTRKKGGKLVTKAQNGDAITPSKTNPVSSSLLWPQSWGGYLKLINPSNQENSSATQTTTNTKNYGTGYNSESDDFYDNGEYGTTEKVSLSGIQNANASKRSSDLTVPHGQEGYDYNDAQANTTKARETWQLYPSNRAEDFVKWAEQWWLQNSNQGKTQADMLADYNKLIDAMYKYKHEMGTPQYSGDNAYRQDDKVREFNTTNKAVYNSANSTGGVNGWAENQADYNGTTTAQRFIDITDNDVTNIDFASALTDVDDYEFKALFDNLVKDRTGRYYSTAPSSQGTTSSSGLSNGSLQATSSQQRTQSSRVTPTTGTRSVEDTDTKNSINLEGILEATAPNAIAVGRYLAARNNNKKLLDIARQMPVMLYDPSERHRWVYGDQAAVQRGYQAAGQLNHLASRAITSDGAQQQAAQMEALMKGQQYIDQGNQQNDKVIQATREANWEQEGKNQESRYTTAMRNRANLFQKRTNDLSALGSYHRANYESLNALLGQFETQAREKAEENKSYRQAAEQASLKNDIAANLTKYGIQATKGEQQLINDVLGGTKTDLNDREQESYDRISHAIEEEVTKRMAAARGVSYRPFKSSTSSDWYTPVPASKRGGVIEASEKVTIQKMKGKIEKMKTRQKHLEARMNAFEKDLDRTQKSTSQYIKGQLKK